MNQISLDDIKKLREEGHFLCAHKLSCPTSRHTARRQSSIAFGSAGADSGAIQDRPALSQASEKRASKGRSPHGEACR